MNQFSLCLIMFFCCLILFLGCTVAARAQVVINEVAPFPDSGNDWVELKNISDRSIDLNGWNLEDSNSQLTPSPALGGFSIASGEHLVFEVGNRLNNSGDQVKLKDYTGALIDAFTYTQSTIDQSWSRIPDGVGNLVLTAYTRGVANSPLASPPPTTSPTPTVSPNPSVSPSPLPSPHTSPTPSSNSGPSPNPSLTPSPSPTPSSAPTAQLPDHIIISEIMACPNTGDPEWVELQNLDSSAYTLTNWQIRDSQNNIRYFSNQIPSQGLIVIFISPAMLNNSGGDEISITRSDGITTSWASYQTCQKGKSLIFNGQTWLSVDPTPGAGNPDLTESSLRPSPTPENIAEADQGDASPQVNSERASDPAVKPDFNSPPDRSMRNSFQFRLLATPAAYLGTPPPDAYFTHASKNFPLNLHYPTVSWPFQLVLPLLLGGSLLCLLSAAGIFYTWYTELDDRQNFGLR